MVAVQVEQFLPEIYSTYLVLAIFEIYFFLIIVKSGYAWLSSSTRLKNYKNYFVQFNGFSSGYN